MKVFLTGAAGYIGGSVAEKLVAAGHEVLGLAKSPDQVAPLKARGIEPVVGLLDDAAVLTAAARAADAVINAANVDHAASVVTLVTALERSGKLFIQTTGSSIVCDHADGAFAAEIPLDEDAWFDPVPFRRARVDMNRYAREAAIGKGVRSIVVCPTMVYGAGRGLQPYSDQIPKLMALARQLGAGVYCGEGLNRYSNVHIDDLADLFLLAMERAPGGSFFFAENGANSFREIASMISDAIGLGGKTLSLSLEDVMRQFGETGRLGVASNSYVSAANARRLGWAPKGPSLAEYFSSLAKT